MQQCHKAIEKLLSNEKIDPDIQQMSISKKWKIRNGVLCESFDFAKHIKMGISYAKKKKYKILSADEIYKELMNQII